MSCASYQNPKGDPATLASIRSTMEGKNIILTPKENYIVSEIDGRKVNYNFSWSSETKNILMTPGSHQLMVEVFARKGMSPYTAATNLDVAVKAGGAYELTGSVNGAEASVWVQDKKSGKTVSTRKTVGLNFIAPSSGPMIFLPAPQ